MIITLHNNNTIYLNFKLLWALCPETKCKSVFVIASRVVIHWTWNCTVIRSNVKHFLFESFFAFFDIVCFDILIMICLVDLNVVLLMLCIFHDVFRIEFLIFLFRVLIFWHHFGYLDITLRLGWHHAPVTLIPARRIR